MHGEWGTKYLSELTAGDRILVTNGKRKVGYFMKSENKKTTMMKAALQYVSIPKITGFDQVSAEKEFSKDIKLLNAIKKNVVHQLES